MKYEKLDTFSEKDQEINAVIETPKGSRNKYALNPEMQVFALDKILPAGAVFPFNFGFIPQTKAEDGDPLDVIVIMDDPAFPGCVIPSRVIGVIKAEQTDKGKKPERNDRIIAVPSDSLTENDLKSIHDLNENIIKEIENFFISYHAQRGEIFKPLGIGAASEAFDVIKKNKK